jgi:hypothetical protein
MYSFVIIVIPPQLLFLAEIQQLSQFFLDRLLSVINLQPPLPLFFYFLPT